MEKSLDILLRERSSSSEAVHAPNLVPTNGDRLEAGRSLVGSDSRTQLAQQDHGERWPQVAKTISPYTKPAFLPACSSTHTTIYKPL